MIVFFLFIVVVGLSIGFVVFVFFDKFGGDDVGGYCNNGIVQDYDNG